MNELVNSKLTFVQRHGYETTKDFTLSVFVLTDFIHLSIRDDSLKSNDIRTRFGCETLIYGVAVTSSCTVN